MSLFHLHARKFRGTLAEPEVNTLQTAESDDHDQALALAEEMSARGFAVWLYEHGPTRLANDEGAYRVIGEWRPNGVRLR